MNPFWWSAAARRLCVAGLGSLLLMLSGCVTQAPAPRPGTTGQVIVPPLAEPPKPETPAVTPPYNFPDPELKPPVIVDYPKTLAAAGAAAPVLALARQAREARAAGLNDAALGHWQRALRIEPKNAFVWHEIASIHLALKHAGQAESAARKSTSLSRGNLWLEAQNWRLIASARRLLLDITGAEAATARADALSAGLAASAP
ncbi:hypothetical protein [Nevskia sp.]|uniref:hypothetical protein n=1 Tax=Nevskia sp. TaxID=1929292 RepID=UPI0025E36FF2|nr:hypothetical protein [Nevskia sp.]